MVMRVRVLRVLVVLGLVSTILLTGCSGEDSDQEASDELSGEVRIAGSSTVYPISVAMAEEFSRMHSDVNIPVQSTGTGAGFANFFIPGNTDINDASRSIKESELQAARENGIEPLDFQVGIDALTVVVNPNAAWVDNRSA
jgi:phosphate transport system substrate-binding protein